MSESIRGLGGLTNSEYEIAGAKFRVIKLKGLAGFELLELIREAMAGSALGAMSDTVSSGDSEAQAGGKMMSAVMSIGTKYVKRIREIALQSTDVKLPASDRFVSLLSQESAINDLIEPIDNYEIIVRFIAVNFTESTVGLMNRVGLKAQAVDADSSV